MSDARLRLFRRTDEASSSAGVEAKIRFLPPEGEVPIYQPPLVDRQFIRLVAVYRVSWAPGSRHPLVEPWWRRPSSRWPRLSRAFCLWLRNSAGESDARHWVAEDTFWRLRPLHGQRWRLAAQVRLQPGVDRERAMQSVDTLLTAVVRTVPFVPAIPAEDLPILRAYMRGQEGEALAQDCGVEVPEVRRILRRARERFGVGAQRDLRRRLWNAYARRRAAFFADEVLKNIAVLVLLAAACVTATPDALAASATAEDKEPKREESRVAAPVAAATASPDRATGETACGAGQERFRQGAAFCRGRT